MTCRMTLMLAGLMSGAIIGCDRPPPAADARGSAPAPTASEQLAALRNLPYAGGVEVDPTAESGVIAIDRDRVQPGYTLLSLFLNAKAVLIDADGRVLKSWPFPGARNINNVELLPDGDLLATGSDPGPTGEIEDENRFLVRLDWTGAIVWKRPLEVHHDAALTPRGEFVSLTFNRRREPGVHEAVDLRDDEITRLDQNGVILSRLSLYDLVTRKPDLFPLLPVEPAKRGGRDWVDVFHCNSVEWMHRPELFDRPLFGPNNVLVCSRHQNRIFIVNTATPELLWAWGQDQLDGPHDATVLENGRIMVFDNGLARGWSRVLEIDPASGQVVWQYLVPADAAKSPQEKGRVFYTRSKGSNQRLPNGNTLICNADQGEVFEVTPDGQVVWHYVTPEKLERVKGVTRAAMVRAYRYPIDQIDDLFRRHNESPPD